MGVSIVIKLVIHFDKTVGKIHNSTFFFHANRWRGIPWACESVVGVRHGR